MQTVCRGDALVQPVRYFFGGSFNQYPLISTRLTDAHRQMLHVMQHKPAEFMACHSGVRLVATACHEQEHGPDGTIKTLVLQDAVLVDGAQTQLCAQKLFDEDGELSAQVYATVVVAQNTSFLQRIQDSIQETRRILCS